MLQYSSHLLNTTKMYFFHKIVNVTKPPNSHSSISSVLCITATSFLVHNQFMIESISCTKDKSQLHFITKLWYLIYDPNSNVHILLVSELVRLLKLVCIIFRTLSISMPNGIFLSCTIAE